MKGDRFHFDNSNCSPSQDGCLGRGKLRSRRPLRMHSAGTQRGNDGNRKEEMELGVVWRIDRAWFSPYGGGWDKKMKLTVVLKF